MQSMTGFGRGEAIVDGVIWRVEAQSVNRKQLEIVLQMPRELAELESVLRNRIGEKLSRGRVQVSIAADRGAMGSGSLRVDEALARQYHEALRRMAGTLGISPSISASDVTRWPGVFSIEQTQVTPAVALPAIEQALDTALQQLLTMRKREGDHLREDISQRLDTLEKMLQAAAEWTPQVVEAYRKTLRQRLSDAGVPLPLDDERLIKEIALFADRTDVSEELTRAHSHIKQFHTYLASGQPVGRSLDFLLQELFREFNTLGSKSNHASLAQLVVQGKTEIEKIREQVQNIE